MEKKEIKISLWTFYVLLAAIVVLVGAVIIGTMGIDRKNQLGPDGLIYEVSDEGHHHTYNDYYYDNIVQNICVDFLYNEALEAKQKSVHKNNRVTLEDIDNETIVTVAYASVAFNNFGSDGYIKVEDIKANKIEKKAQEIFGKNVTVEHQDIPFYGVVYENEKYIPTEVDEELQNTFEYNRVYSEIVKVVLNGEKIIVYEEYEKEVYNEHTSTREYYATTDLKLQLANNRIS